MINVIKKVYKSIINYFKEVPIRFKYAWYNLKLNHKMVWETSNRISKSFFSCKGVKNEKK